MPVAQNPFKTPEFRKLLQEWNGILKESGFEDAEDFDLPDPALKTWHGLKFSSGGRNCRSDPKTYYDLASELLSNGFPFKNDLYRRTWELHCMGLSYRKIRVTLEQQLIGYIGQTKSNVQRIIVEIQKAAGLKHE